MKHEDVGGMDATLVEALRSLPYGLYLLTTGSLDDPRGMLVSWVSQVGGDPPLIMCAVRQNRAMLPQLTEQGAFALNLLPDKDMEMLGALSRLGPERFQGLDMGEGPLGLPVLGRAVGALFCRIIERSQPGDHVLFVGQVETAQWQGPGPIMNAGFGGHAYLGLR